MADEGSTERPAATDDDSGVHRLRDIVVEEVSLVDRAANKRRFLLVKRSSQMANDGKSKDATSQDSRTGATSGAGARGKKPRPNPDEEVGKARPRVMRAAGDDDEDDEDETEKARRSTQSEDEDDEEETEKARRSESDDEEEDDDVDADKAADEDDEGDDDGEKDEKNKPKRGRPASSGKRSTRAGKGAPGDKLSDRTGKRTRKAKDDGLVLPAAAKNAVLRALAQALERLMAVANQVKEADEPDDETDASVPGDLTEELEDIGELLEDVGEQLEEPAEKKVRDKKPDAAKGRSAKADVSKAGRRMAKDRLERFQKALELLAAVLKELTNEKPAPTPSAGAAEKPLGKRASPEVGDLVTSVQELTRVVKQQGEQLGRLQKTRATSNAIPIEGGGRRREVQDVSWPLDMNRPITRDRVDKAISFYDEE
jgi:hypothetical protein